MQVKRLELQGFKSFKDKTVIHFDQGITGVVGPNGCGKSNIVDAFFWVMGEQSYKHMRGSSSDDLIFNGSSKYQPLGYAEATLVLETGLKEDQPHPVGATTQDIPIHLRAKEVSVTRKLYRTGECDYFINGMPARLKDIRELFMDTGVGAKGYSVIEQGQIAKIVQAKPEERRQLIEEAAGIAKYKARKKESLRKIEAAQGNLSRLHDVVQEIERGLASLERQAQKAKRYKEYKDELISKEMTWGRRKKKILDVQIAEMSAKRAELDEAVLRVKTELQTTENQISVLELKGVEESKRAEDAQAELQSHQNWLVKEQSELDLARRRREDLAIQLQSFESERSELENLIQTESNKIAERSHAVLIAEGAYQRLSERVITQEEELKKVRQDYYELKNLVETFKKNLLLGVSRASELQAKIASLEGKAESLRSQLQKAEEELSRHQGRYDEAKLEATLSAQKKHESQELRERAEGELKNAMEDERSLATEFKETQNQKLEWTTALTGIQSRLESLEELEKALEGYGSGTKAALEWGRERGLEPLSQLIEVQSGFERAVEAVFSESLESILAPNFESASEVLSHLKEGKLGQAMFWINRDSSELTQAQTQERMDAFFSFLRENEFEVVGSLREKITVQNTSLSGWVNKLLQGVVVVESMAPIAKLFERNLLSHLQGLALISLDGTYLDGTGLLKGGQKASEESTTILGRKRIIVELRAQVEEWKSKLDSISENLNDLSNRWEAKKALVSEMSQVLRKSELELVTSEQDHLQKEKSLKLISEEYNRLDKEKLSVHGILNQVEGDQVEAQGNLGGWDQEKHTLEEQIALKSQEHETLEQKQRALEEELSLIRVEEAQTRERLLSLRREDEGARAMLYDRERRLLEIQHQADRMSGEVLAKEEAAQVHEKTIAELNQRIYDQNQHFASLKNELAGLSQELQTKRERIKEFHQLNETRSSEVQQLMIEGERLNADLHHLILNLEEKYGPGCLERVVEAEGVQEQMDNPIITTEMTQEEEKLLSEEVEELREKIRRLGEVNVMAIEEFEELRKRHESLTQEKLDLEKSIDDLNEAIEHINKTSIERFQKAFDAIADRFQRLFPIVFGGGSAQLSMVYPEGITDVLEAGVDVLAQPPGKKVSNIGLLSGGEKALTAVCFIFAIFMVKPSPFCILDEVDAPLDDANIGKFNALLREMSSKSQFIVITHNKKTMELNDVLYGVTMEEPGVSKMVSIALQ